MSSSPERPASPVELLGWEAEAVAVDLPELAEAEGCGLGGSVCATHAIYLRHRHMREVKQVARLPCRHERGRCMREIFGNVRQAVKAAAHQGAGPQRSTTALHVFAPAREGSRGDLRATCTLVKPAAHSHWARSPPHC